MVVNSVGAFAIIFLEFLDMFLFSCGLGVLQVFYLFKVVELLLNRFYFFIAIALHAWLHTFIHIHTWPCFITFTRIFLPSLIA